MDEIRTEGRAPDFPLLAALIDYITQVPEKLHHPKEDNYLFACLRQRNAADLIPLLDRLQAQHRDGAMLICELQSALIHFLALGEPAFAAFDEQVRRYREFTWEHLRAEETELLPQARRILTAEDWATIDAAFEANREPWSGPTGEYQTLFSRIVNMVPPPYGVGPAQ